MPKRLTTTTDIRIGNLIRMRRVQLGMSQTELGEKLGVAFQQVQKYERGQNRISAGRMPLVAEALGVPISYFYGHDDGAAGVGTAAIDSIELLTERHAVELLEYFRAMTYSQRNALLEIARAVAAGNAASAAPGVERSNAARLSKTTSRRRVPMQRSSRALGGESDHS
jgi:transcriptional regulator with XRE-family HTH domain